MLESPMISIVDYDSDARDSIEALLLSLGYGAIAFESANDFLSSRHIKKTDCLITDIQMPGLSGFDLQHCLAANGYSIPVIFITAFPDERFRARAMRAGGVGFLSKPFREDALIHCLEA